MFMPGIVYMWLPFERITDTPTFTSHLGRTNPLLGDVSHVEATRGDQTNRWLARPLRESPESKRRLEAALDFKSTGTRLSNAGCQPDMP